MHYRHIGGYMKRIISLVIIILVAVVSVNPIYAQSSSKTKKSFVVVIDAGHGGKETGAIYGGVYEKNLNLDIAKRLNNLLKAQGVKTYMTRTDDRYVGLYARSELANKVKADLFVSVHNNAGYKKDSGTMTLYYPNANQTGKKVASIVQKSLTSTLGSRSMGVISRPNLAVLRTTDMPAILAEVGYMTNSKELSKLKTSSYKQKAAEALNSAILKSLNEIKK